MTLTATPPPLIRLMTADDVAEILGVTTDRVWSLTRDKKLPAVKLGGRTYRYRPDAVAQAIEDMET